MMRKLLGIILILPLLAAGQQPFINNISPTNIEVGQTVTISGTDLGGRVFFGGVEATSVSGSGNSMTATVPAGATHGVITVINNNLVAQSSKQFYISFSGSDITSYYNEFLVSTTEQAASDICMCDLDGDNKNDIIILHNLESTDNSQSEFTVYFNNTGSIGELTAGDFALDGRIFNNAINQSGFISVSCSDLDHDGRQDLVFTSNRGTNAREIYVYQNQSTPGNINLNALDISNLQLPQTSGGDNRIPRTIKSADMDGDGKNDLIVGNSTDNTFHIYKNTSSGAGSFSFASPSEHSSGDDDSGLIELADLNSDGAMDVITMPFRRTAARGSSINAFQNQSILDNFSFADPITLNNITEISSVSSGDFDEDGLIDLVVARRTAGILSYFRNTSSGTLSFGAPQVVNTGNSAFGVDLGDMNGDGKLDLISSYAAGTIRVFENTSSTGNISFSNEQTLATGSTTQSVCIGDLNGDGKPDIAYTQNVQTSQVGNLGIIINNNCLVPVISPNDIEFCLNDPFTVTATKSAGATYAWEIISGGGTDPVDTDEEAEFTITSGTTVTIGVTVTQDGCSEQSTATFNMLGGSQPTPPTFNAGTSDNICVGDDYDIDVSGGPFNEYEWTLPNGTTQVTTAGTLSLTNADANDAGTYMVRAKSNAGCYSEESLSFNLVVSQPPLFQIFNNNRDNFCSTSSVTLEVSDFSSDYDYQWMVDGTPLGTNSPSLTTNQSGNYTVMLTDKVDNCTNETGAYTINAVSEPVSIVNGPTEVCQNIESTFTAGSTGQSGFTLEYSWLVDGTPVNPTDPTELVTTFSSLGSHTITLTTSYNSDEVLACTDQTIFNVTVSAAPSITFDTTDGTQKCQGDNINIEVTNTGISTFNWYTRNAETANDTIVASNVSSTSIIDLNTPGVVDSIYAVVEIVTTIGCVVKDSIKIRNFPSLADISSPDFASILTDNNALLEDATSINLVAENIASNFAWEPADQFDDPSAATVTFFPQNPLTTVSLTGVDADGCPVATEVTIELDNIRPRRTFSPNGDGMNDCWEILNIGDLGVPNGCTVYVFDSRGKNILVQDVFDNGNCVWNGDASGSPVPEGVYYFVMKCETAGLSQTGSILLAR